MKCFNPSNAELNPKYHFLALLGAHNILRVSRIRVTAGSRIQCKNLLKVLLLIFADIR